MGNLRIAFAVGVSLAALAVACSGSSGSPFDDPSFVPDSGIGVRPDADPPPRDSGTDSSKNDAGLDAGHDAGRDSGPVTAFTDAPPYKYELGPSLRVGSHSGLDPNMNPAGEACGNCHDKTAQTLVVGGTVYNSKNADSGVPGAEVVIRFPDGGTFVVHTDGDGNFAMKQSFDVKETPRGTLVGVRTASERVLKPTPLEIGQGDCMTSCHTSNVIHVP